MNPSENCDPATTLARALDREDYAAAGAILRDDCVYEFRDEVIEGADAIMARYQTTGEIGRDRFDEIEYLSAVAALSPGRARIDYTDIVTHAGDRIVHRCAQEITFDSGGRVTRIKHIDIEGEREALEAFIERHAN